MEQLRRKDAAEKDLRRRRQDEVAEDRRSPQPGVGHEPSLPPRHNYTIRCGEASGYVPPPPELLGTPNTPSRHTAPENREPSQAPHRLQMPIPDALPLNREDTRPPETINAPNLDGVVVQDPPRVLHVEDEPTTLDEAADNTPIPADIQLEYGSRIPSPRTR